MKSLPNSKLRHVVGVPLPFATAVLIWWSIDRGRQYRDDVDVKVQAAPLVGEWRWQLSWWLLLPVAIGVLTIVWSARSAHRSFRVVALGSGLAAGLFAVTLAASDGWAKVMDPVVHPSEYWYNLDTLPSPAATVRAWSNVDFLLDYSVHLKGHPPGFVMLLQWFESIGLGAPWVTAALCWAGIISVVPAVLLCVREVAGETVAYRCAPFLVLAPYAVWSATSADAFYGAVLAWGCACCVIALRRDTWKLSITAGVLLCYGLYMSYGAVLFLPIPLALVLFSRRRNLSRAPGGISFGLRFKVLIGTTAGALAVTLAFALAGFWWFDGLATTQKFYVWGTAQFRPWQYFIVANIGALAIAVGSAVVFGISQLIRSGPAAVITPRINSVWLLVGSAALCITAANVSGMSKAEVERIWLIFMPFLVPATATLKHPRLWLTVQLALCLVVQAGVATKW
jgi:methylthioxylose transferase